MTVTDTHSSPVITDPEDKSYDQGEAITAFAIEVSYAGNDKVTGSAVEAGLRLHQQANVEDGGKGCRAQDYTATITAYAARAGVGQLALIRLSPDAGDVSIANHSWTMSHRSASMSPTGIMKDDRRPASRTARNIMGRPARRSARPRSCATCRSSPVVRCRPNRDVAITRKTDVGATQPVAPQVGD